MSINVNVSGNPVRINRGTLVAADPDYAKKEFDKRRRMRLEQVRHQSKEIAETVRNKVRNQKKKQLSDFEKEEEEKLKKWQNRKLLELQQQYCESLKNIGLGHAQATIENACEESEAQERQKLIDKSIGRGEVAELRLQAERNKENLKKARPLQNKKLSRDIENARSAMVSKHKKTPSKKRKKKKETNINITTNISDDSNSISEEEDIEELDLPSDDYDSSMTEKFQSGARRKRTGSKSPSTYEESRVNSPVKNRLKSPKNMHKTREAKTNDYKSASPIRIKPPRETSASHYAVDTRISDRIKNRRYLMNPTHTCDSYMESDANRITLQSEASTSINVGKPVDKTTSTTYNQGVCSCACTCSKHNSQIDGTEIPIKPTIGIKSLKTASKDSQVGDSKVQYYDHDNRFSKEYVSRKSSVQRIPEENIEICPSTGSEKEYMDRLRKYDKDAEERGKRAMEKVNIRKEYKEMMKKLPVLQKQERIAAIGEDKPIFHMSQDRYKEYQKQKQNYLDNIYERNFPKTITITPKEHIIEEEPFKTVDISKSNPSLNVAQWDVNKQADNGFTLTKDSGHILIQTDLIPDSKEDYLKYLLERLKQQKEMLIREAASLPRNSNLTNIINDLESFRHKENEFNLKPEEFGEKLMSNTEYPDECIGTNTKDEELKQSEKKSSKQKRIHQAILSTSTSSTSSTPSKKKKFRRYKIILQNTSTQTSPKIMKDTSDDKENNRDIPSSKEVSSAAIIPKDKRPFKKHTPRKSSSTTKAAKTTKITVSRPTSPFKTGSSRDQASSPINSNVVARENAKSSSSIGRSIKCKCYAKDQAKMCKCKCHNHAMGDQSELCEILIKIKDNEEPEIQINSPTKQRKNVIIKDLTEKGKDKKQQIIEDLTRPKHKDTTKRTVKINDKRSEMPKSTWKEQFSKNETAGTSTSTSYFSPPDFTKSDSFKRPQAESTCTRSTNISRKSSQNEKNVDPRLLIYIKKLLSMSRTSIEDLGVSTVSDVSTPSGSFFDHNTAQSRSAPLNQLKNVIKYFNLNPEDLARYLNYSEDTDQTSGSLFNPNLSSPSTVHSSGYDAGKSRGNNATSSYSDHSKTQESRAGSANSKLSLEQQKARSRSRSPCDKSSCPTPISQYAQLAELCQNRISELATMIERVRLEKQQILSPIQSDKENSTQYLGLPPQFASARSPSIAQDNSYAKSSTNSDAEQAEINRKMLEIDYSLAERLKLMTPEQIMEYNKNIEFNKLNAMSENSKELLEGYGNLMNVYGSVTGNESKSQGESIPKIAEINSDIRVEENIVEENVIALHSPEPISYVPVLLNIPRLPKLVPHNEQTSESLSLNSLGGKYRKPPPAKGLMAAKRFNENITNLPHELSTIAEVDSQLSTRLRPSISPEPPSNRTSPFKDFNNINPVIVLPDFPTNWPEEAHKSDEKKISQDGSVPDILAEINADEVEKKDEGVQAEEQPKNVSLKVYMEAAVQKNVTILRPEPSTDSSTEKSESDNIEAMLKSMGMGWAISTLKKTQEALNRASSSSSLDATSKLLSNKSDSSSERKSQKISNKSSTSDITLRDVLGKRIFSNTSTSSLSEILSPHLVKTLEDLSAIHGSGKSSDNKQQRTSTPVHTTKSSESHKKGIFTAESEVSSVKFSDDFATMRDTSGNSSD